MTTLKGIFPDPKPIRRKNFIQENVRNLRRLEHSIHKDTEEFQKSHKFQRNGKYQNITARVDTSVPNKKHDGLIENTESNVKNNENQPQPCRKKSAPIFNKFNSSTYEKALKPLTNSNGLTKQKKQEQNLRHKQQDLRIKVLPNSSIVHTQQDDSTKYVDSNQVTRYKNQGIQTLDEKHMDTLYADGIIRYPTNKNCTQEVTVHKEKLNRKGNGIGVEQSNIPSDRGDACIPKTTQDVPNTTELLCEEVDHIKLNKEKVPVACKLATQLNNGVPPPKYRKGVVPKYIRDRKDALEKEQKEKAEASSTDCPEGHVSLPDNERKETLRMLKKNYQDYVNELNMMPIRTDTLRAQRRKMEIERQLNKLEEGIKVFSRPKVYVKVNA